MLVVFMYSLIIKDFWNPVFLFIFPLTIQYCVYCGLYASEEPVSYATNLLFTSGIYSFMLGYFCITYVKNRKKKILEAFHYNPQIYRFLFIVSILFIIFGIIDLLQNRIYGIYDDNILRNIRYNSLYASKPMPFYSKYGPLILYVLCLLEFEKFVNQQISKYKMIFMCLLLYSTTLFSVARTAILQYTLSILFFLHIYIKENFKHCTIKLLLIYTILAIAMCYMFNIVALYLMKIGDTSLLSKNFYIYKYIGYPIITFDKFVVDSPCSTGGYYTLGPIGKILEMIGIFPDNISQIGFYIPPGIFNVTTYIQAPYNDWGILGVIFAMVIWGGISGFIYRHAKLRAGLWRVFYANYIYSLVIAFYAYQFFLSSHVYIFFLLFLLSIQIKISGEKVMEK